MKTSLIFAAALGIATFGAHAHADSLALRAGAAHLDAAGGSLATETFVLRHDPSGAPMCFDLAGNKAPLASCEEESEESNASREHIVAFDPSGAPMCFDMAGNKAPLAACGDLLGGEDRRELAIRQ